MRDRDAAVGPTRFAPHGIRLRERPALSELPMPESGEIEIQDEGSQPLALLVGTRPGMGCVLLDGVSLRER